MVLVLERPHDQYGSAVFIRNDINVTSACLTDFDDIEVLTVDTPQFSVTSIYKPPEVDWSFHKPLNFSYQKTNFIIGDFNCQSITWGYRETSENGEKLETWADAHNLQLIHNPKLPSSFNSGRWKRGYNPDNIFVSSKIAAQCEKLVGQPIPHTQHRPIICITKPIVQPEQVPFRRRFNFKKADWERFAADIDDAIKNIPAHPDSYETFIDLVKSVSRQTIPRGCRTSYVPGLTPNAKLLLEKYQTMFNIDPFSDETIELGEELLLTVNQNHQDKWIKLVEGLDMKLNSRRAWKLLGNLSGDSTKQQHHIINVTANQVASQLLQNGKFPGRKSREQISRNVEAEEHMLEDPFLPSELETAMLSMKSNKAAGIDDLRTEQIKHFGKRTKQWLLDMMNACVQQLHIPKMWRKSRVVALLKPGKEPDDPKNFRPVSLLCHTFKLLERLILNRIAPSLERKFIPEQAGFRPGKSCCGQVVNLTQHIEDGFEHGMITGVAFIDLTAAYDTVNHKKLLNKIYSTTKDYHLTMVIKTFLQNRRFYVTLQNKQSRWRNQKNGLSQGSVLAPVLYNVYTNDQPRPSTTRQFIYADDTAVAAQGCSFEEVEDKLTSTLHELSAYYEANHLKPNARKTQVCSFHLKNREARRELNITWRGERLQHCQTPKYLGITLDRSLTFKDHCTNTRAKISSRNNILRKLTSRRWGSNPETLRISALGLCVSTSEYASPVWGASSHAKQVDVALNDTMRIITGCLKATPVQKLYPLTGIAPPHIRRAVAANIERKKQEEDPRHPLYSHVPAARRLKSRSSFLARTKQLVGTPEENRLDAWKMEVQSSPFEVKEHIAPGSNLPYPIWRTLNRLRVGVPRCKTNLEKWGLLSADENVLCECGAVQDPEHLLICPNLPYPCTYDDLIQGNDKAIMAANHWINQI
ncbi:hypothetical protein M8J77_020382 [Diaphorina citri]|nr:hypothetical protein M8J77_020382 [Diaphorina citri]